jgi:ribonuclease J
LVNVAKASGRKLCVAGRSLDKIIAAAQANGYLKKLPELIDIRSVDALKRHEVMIIATGGQGEERAALARVAAGTHPVKLEEGDTVIFSSKQIPGNEVAIGRVMNQLARRNIRTVTEKQAHIHVSGHPGQGELAKMYDWIKPDMLIPVHGERRHMAEQARFGLAQGIKRSIVQSNGDVVRLAPNGPEIIGQERTGRLVLDGEVIIAADGATMNERRKLRQPVERSMPRCGFRAFQLKKIATISSLKWSRQLVALLTRRLPMTKNCAKPCALASAAWRPTGLARNRLSMSCC